MPWNWSYRCCEVPDLSAGTQTVRTVCAFYHWPVSLASICSQSLILLGLGKLKFYPNPVSWVRFEFTTEAVAAISAGPFQLSSYCSHCVSVSSPQLCKLRAMKALGGFIHHCPFRMAFPYEMSSSPNGHDLSQLGTSPSDISHHCKCGFPPWVLSASREWLSVPRGGAIQM